LIQAMLGEWDTKPARELFFEIVRAEIQRFDLGRFAGQNMELLAFQITEHTGKAGEHYITRNRHEWKKMFASAVLGGIIVSVLSVLKVLISKLHLPPVPEALAFGTLYSAGFVFLHHVGGTLATKQPAMTASTLASSMDEAASSKEAMDRLGEMIIRTMRSQLTAVLGNYLAAFPAALFFCLPFFMLHHPLMDPTKAWATLDSLNMFKSLSIFYAALTGVLLFVSGLLAGFADNWFVFNHVGQRLKQSSLLRTIVGPAGLQRAIHTIDNNLGFWTGAITLGFFLGSATAIGNITGLPIDIRHITFSSGTFGAAAASLNFQIPARIMVNVAVTVFLIGLTNLAVSFSLSLFVAVKSRRVRFSQTPELLAYLGRRFRQSPLDFILPLKDPP
jgi:site-specific recombinase